MRVVAYLLLIALTAGTSDTGARESVESVVERILDSGSLILLGEHHGTEELPALTAELAGRALSSGERVLIGLELETGMEPEVATFLSEGSEAARRQLVLNEEWTSWHDGRTSEAMLALLTRLGELSRRFPGNLHVELLLDPANLDQGGRNKGHSMAAALTRAISEFQPTRIITLTGNWHNRLGRNPSPSMADALASSKPVTFAARPGGGTAWMCSSPNAPCGPVEFPADPSITEVDIRFFEDPAEKGYHSLILFPEFTASPPAVAR